MRDRVEDDVDLREGLSFSFSGDGYDEIGRAHV